MVEALETISLEPPKLAVCYVCNFALYTQHVPIQCGVFQSGDVSAFVVLHESNSVLRRTITAHCSTSILHILDYFCGTVSPLCFSIKLQVFNQQLILNCRSLGFIL